MSMKEGSIRCKYFSNEFANKKLGTGNCFEKELANYKPVENKGRDFSEKDWKLESTWLSFGRHLFSN